MDQEKGKSLPSEYWLSTNFANLTMMFKSKRVNKLLKQGCCKAQQFKAS